MRAGFIFDVLYRLGLDDWNIGAPQPDLVALAESGRLGGRILDVGCGTGDNAIFLGLRGHDVTGLDASRRALAQARERAAAAGARVVFVQGDALALASQGLGTFDTILDYGLLHQLTGETRRRYVAGLHRALGVGGRLVVQCLTRSRWSLGLEPRGLSSAELLDVFGEGWRAEQLQAARYVVRVGAARPAHLAVFRRQEAAREA